MSTDDFTEPFDLDRWVAGEPAYSLGSQRLLHFKCIREGRHDAIECDAYTIPGDNPGWRMKPRAEESLWIPHDGGECPIPWAKEGEFEVKGRDERVVIPPFPANVRGIWMQIFGNKDVVAYRLTDRWLPVKGDGTIPKKVKNAKAGEWEYRLRNGAVGKAKMYSPLEHIFSWEHQYGGLDVVAVRLIPKELADGLKEANEKGVDLARQLIENQKALSDPKEIQKRLTREASTRYFAKLHAVEKITPPISEAGIENAIFEALCKELKK